MQRSCRSNNLLQRKCYCNKLAPIIFVVYCNEITKVITYYNEKVVVITIVYCNKIIVALTYYLGVYCNGSQRLFGRCNRLYCNENGLIATTFFVVINNFSCSGCTTLPHSLCIPMGVWWRPFASNLCLRCTIVGSAILELEEHLCCSLRGRRQPPMTHP